MVDFTTNYMDKDVVDNKYSAITKEGLNAITSAMDLSVYQHKEAERQQKLSLLAEEDLAYTIRKNINYFWVDYLFDGAKKWCEMKTQKYDKRKRYTEQDNYNCLLGMLKEIFKVETLEIIRMTYLGFDQCEMWIEFTTDNDYVFRLEIPNVKAITPKNMVSLRYGKAGLAYYENSCCIKCCGSSYIVTDLCRTMNDIITLPEHQKHLSKSEHK